MNTGLILVTKRTTKPLKRAKVYVLKDGRIRIDHCF
jgi:hypothetical protein